MKKVLSTLAAVAAVAMACNAFAATSIVNSKHNLSSGGTTGFKAGNTTQVCVFCHTPHNAAKNQALWNRIAGSTDSQFRIYTSGIKMANGTADTWFVNQANKGQLDVKSSSLLCMTCHDGVTNMYALANPPAGVTTLTSSAGGNSNVVITDKPNLGQNLTNDHPININYNAAQTALGSTYLIANPAGLPLANGTNLECSTCHNVHDDTLKPFLRISIDGSALCVACHVK